MPSTSSLLADRTHVSAARRQRTTRATRLRTGHGISIRRVAVLLLRLSRISAPVLPHSLAKATRRGSLRGPRARSLEPGLADELGDEIALDGLKAAFRAVARILNPAERHFRQSEPVMIDGDHPSL